MSRAVGLEFDDDVESWDGVVRGRAWVSTARHPRSKIVLAFGIGTRGGE